MKVTVEPQVKTNLSTDDLKVGDIGLTYAAGDPIMRLANNRVVCLNGGCIHDALTPWRLRRILTKGDKLTLEVE